MTKTSSSRAAHERFLAKFGREPAVVTWAPGRVNLIGEHTDYNGGWVLPTPLPLGTHVLLAPRDDKQVRVCSANIDGDAFVSYDLGALTPGRGWIDYLQGLHVQLHKAGHLLSGVDVFIASDLPLGGGLSSSAALEVAFLRALRSSFHLSLTDVEIAQLGQACENEFVGAAVGIMDQMVASVGEPGKALLLNTSTLSFEQWRLSPSLELAVIHSGVRHAHSENAYNRRRKECEAASKALGLTHLCAKPSPDASQVAQLPVPLNRRARHVISEDARVLAAAQAARSGDSARLGALLYESHASLRDDYEVSIPVVDSLVAAAAREPFVLGARMTGGGFGGCVLVLTSVGSARAAARHILAACAITAPNACLIWSADP